MQFGQLKRREFITVLGGAAAVWPLSARAQEGERVRHVGVLMGTADTDADQNRMVAVFTRALSELGWKEGANINIDYRWAAGDPARLQAHAAELAGFGLDAIFVQGTPATTAFGEQRLQRRWCS